jgi:hypothetical protein
MYIFSRTRIANPADAPAARELAVQMATATSKITGQPITAFETRFGDPGSITWSTTVKDMAQLDDLTTKLAADPTYLKLLAQARPLFSLPTDRLMQIVASSITSSQNTLYSSTSAVTSPGNLAAAIGFGIHVQEYVAKAGFAGLFGTSVFGAYGEVGWMLAADSMAEMDRFRAFQTSDAGFAKLIDEGGSLFIPGSGVNRLVSRI